MNFMLPVPEASLPAVDSGIDGVRILDVEVRVEDHLEPSARRRVVVHHSGHAVDQPDDEPRHVVAGCGLSAEDEAARRERKLRVSE
jgi:hypothetical protein